MADKRLRRASVLTGSALIIGAGIAYWRMHEGGAHLSGANFSPNASTPGGASAGAEPSIANSSAAARSFQSIRAETNTQLRLSKAVEWEVRASVLDIVQALESLSNTSDATLRQQLLRDLTAKDPQAAAEWVANRATGADRQALINTVAIVWSGKNTKDAIAWARTLAPEEKGVALEKIAYESAPTDVAQSLGLAGEIPAGESRDRLLTHIASQWATRDPQQIADWAKQINDPNLRQQIISHVASVWGDADPARAAELALTAIPPGKSQSDAIVGIVQRWSQTAPSDAAAWVLRFPEGDMRESAVTELTKLWADKDLDAAGKWINSIAPGPMQDTALSAYAQKEFAADPESAIVSATRITDEKARDTTLEDIAGRWLQTDAAAAEAWLNNSPLPDAVKARLLAAKPQ